MTPEAADYLAKARATLADAEQIATLPLPHVPAREAYDAAYHAAEAYIFEQTRFLATAYQLKAVADYGIGAIVVPISADQATAAIVTARRFVDTVTQLLSPSS